MRKLLWERRTTQCPIFKYENGRINGERKRSEMQWVLLIALLVVQAVPCDANLEAQLQTLLEDASLLLHKLSRQHLLWQCNAKQAPSDAHRLASCQQAARGEAETVLLKLPTIESLAELLEQLAAPNDLNDEVSNYF